MSSAADGLINIQGYIRKQGRQITIKAGDRKKAKEEKEQLLFDFVYDSSQSRSVEYERNSTGYSLYIAQQLQHYREQEKDNVIIFRLIREVGGTSISSRLLMQTSLKNGFVSFLYLHAPGGQIYTIDLLPAPNARKDSLLVPIYPSL